MSGLYDDLREEVAEYERRADAFDGTPVGDTYAAVQRRLSDLLATHTPPSEPATEGLRDDVTPEAVLALRVTADNMPLARPGQPWAEAANWLRRRADAFELAIAEANTPAPVATGATTSENEACDDRGPRIGEDGTRCRLPKGHEGSHRTAPEDGFGRASWPQWKASPQSSSEDEGCDCGEFTGTSVRYTDCPVHGTPPPSSDTDRDVAPSDLQATPRLGGADRDTGLSEDEREAIERAVCTLGKVECQVLGHNHTRHLNRLIPLVESILAARARVQPEGEEFVEWGVRSQFGEIVRVADERRAWLVAGSKHPERVFRRTVTSYPDRVGEWETVGGDEG